MLEKSGSHLMLAGKSVGAGRDKARDALVTDPKLYETVRAATLEALPSTALRAGSKRAA